VRWISERRTLKGRGSDLFLRNRKKKKNPEAETKGGRSWFAEGKKGRQGGDELMGPSSVRIHQGDRLTIRKPI